MTSLLDLDRDLDALLRQEARRSFLVWCRHAMSRRSQRPAAHHRLLIRELQAVVSGEVDRTMILMPPGSAKSTYASVLLPPWLMMTPDTSIIGASNTATLAEQFSRRAMGEVLEDSATLGYRPLTAGAELWSTSNGGQYRAVGVGGTITGFRANYAILDDPIRGREDAESETIREKTWNWYRADLTTRLKPGGAIVLIQCMTGDTPVLMADGAEKPLQDIRAGDAVATYEDGRISTSTVRNWRNQGPDYVYEIKTTSGIIVRANERHPFLVDRGGGLEWTKLRQLVAGDVMLRASGGNGEVCPAPSTGAKSRPSARVSASRTTTRRYGRAGIDHPRSMLNRDETPTCGTGTALGLKNIEPFSLRRTESAQSVSNRPERMFAPIGAESSASIIATKQAAFAACSATTATLPLATGKPRKSYSTPLDTFGIVPDAIVSIRPIGREDVFDIEVERTENFIANGLISHNTRWHQDDLAGRLLEVEGDQARGGRWRVVSIPAQAIADDPLGRAPGEWLWSDDAYRYGEMLKMTKEDFERAGAMRDWSALYQQTPTALEGSIFKITNIATIETAPAGRNIVRGWDLAATEKTGTRDPDWTVGLKLMRTSEGRFIVLDVVRLRGGPDDVEAAIVNTAHQDGPSVQISLPQDPGQAGKQQVLYLTRKLSGFRVDSSPETGDKATRAAPAASQVNVGNFALVRAHWNRPFLDELAAFPSGTKDDQVDALSRAFAPLGMGFGPMKISDAALSNSMRR